MHSVPGIVSMQNTIDKQVAPSLSWCLTAAAPSPRAVLAG